MKKTVCILMMVIVLLATTGCGSFSQSSGPSNEELIESFVPDSFNQKTLNVGDVDKPSEAGWLQNGGEVYSSDSSVATVSADGTVKGVSGGVAYVLIKTNFGNMQKLVKYIISE